MPKANTNKLVAVVFDGPYKAEEARAALIGWAAKDCSRSTRPR